MSIQLSRYPICRHTLTNGHRCKSPAQATSAFCHHHRKLRRTTIVVPQSTPLQLNPHPLRDARSIQQALGLILDGLASGRLAPAPAGKMLYALQLAIADSKTPPRISMLAITPV
jgi:hypothetical protein